MVWLTNERRLVLFPVGIFVRDSHHRQSPTRRFLKKRTIIKRKTIAQWVCSQPFQKCSKNCYLNKLNKIEQDFLRSTRKLQNDFLILDEWFFSNFLVLDSDKYHFVILGAPNTLPSFKCKSITMKNSASEKLLGVIMDNKLDFREHLNTVCKKANLKLHALNRISRFLSPEQHVIIISAYIKSLSIYCPFVSMFY